MAEKSPPRVRFIEVKPAVDNGKNLPPIKDKNDITLEKKNETNRNKARRFTVKTLEISEHERQLAEIDESFLEVELAFSQQDQPKVNDEGSQDIKKGVTEIQEVKELTTEVKKKKKKVKKNAVLPLDVTKSDFLEGINEQQREEFNIGEPISKNDKTKKAMKDKTKKKKKEKKESTIQTTETKKEPEQEIVAAPLQNNEETDDKKKTKKLPCCFGFISTWLAKRKQKRRDKKKKAIADRANPPKLVQYEHKKANGGEAFVIEVDSRPILQKPLLPPIQQTSGRIRRADYRLQAAEERRREELAKRREIGRNYERKKAECKERKSEADYHFRKKANLTIRYKQADAERNRNNLSRRTTTTRPASMQSSSCESVIIESNPDAFKVDETDPYAWKVDDVDIFSY